jgi:hypothetical protein
MQRIAFGLAVSALLLAGTALGTRYYRQQEVLDGLHAETAVAAAKAKVVLGMIDKLQQQQAIVLSIRGKRDEPGLLDLWEETTRVLPLGMLRPVSGARSQAIMSAGSRRSASRPSASS